MHISDEEVYCRPVPDSRLPRGWLVDLINKFGNLGGFKILLERFQTGENLSVAVMYSLIRPFGLCYELLTVNTIVKYFMPVIVSLKTLLLTLSLRFKERKKSLYKLILGNHTSSS